MKVLILGAGVVGTTLAATLATRGHTVVVADRGAQAASETSFANGGQLSYAHAEPWANPHLLPKLPGWLLRADSPLVFRPRWDPAMFAWGLKFLSQCRTSAAIENCKTLLRLGLYSQNKMPFFWEKTTSVPRNTRGILHIFSTQNEWNEAIKHAKFQAQFGCEEHVVSREEVLKLEPTLEDANPRIIGGIHAIHDESGDAQLFTQTLADWATREHGVQFLQNVVIEKIVGKGGKISHVQTSVGHLTADAVVCAMGSYSPLFLKPLGINVPIYPMKGYSITLPANDATPNISITDGSKKIVYSRLGDTLRIAGTAEFAGYNTELRGERVGPIRAAAEALLPHAAWEAPVCAWACLRPSTPDGPPYLGATPYSNLFLNTGHGTLGWTQAAASAFIVADVMEGKTPEISLQGLTLNRRSGA